MVLRLAEMVWRPLSRSLHASETAHLHQADYKHSANKSALDAIVILKRSAELAPTVYKDEFRGKPWRARRANPALKSGDEELSTGEKRGAKKNKKGNNLLSA